jgi:DNA-binding NarL/FixJ family response regulator
MKRDLKRTSIGIIEPETLFRKGLVEMIKPRQNYQVICDIAHGNEILDRFEGQLPDILIIGLKAQPISGVHVAETIRKKFPDTKIIILSSYYLPPLISLISRIGIHGYISTKIDQSELYNAIEDVKKNRVYLTEPYKDIMLYAEGSDISSLHSQFSVIEKISDRELEILTLICHEYTNVEIAKKLFLSVRTIEGHRNSLLSKTGAKNTVGLVLYALIYKLVNIDYKLLQFSSSTPFNKL